MSNTETHRKPIIIIPAPPRKEPRRSGYKGPRPLALLLALLVLVALVQFLILAHQSSSPILAPAANCAGLIRSTDFTQRVNLQTATEQMAAVELVNPLDGGQPAALAQVTHDDAQHTLDVYIFGCSMRTSKPQLTTLFAQRNLSQGTVEVSQANTLITGALDTTISPDASAFLLPLQQNIYREYAWQDGVFSRVAFPGLYPVASSAEAEALQQIADSGQTQPWNDPLAAAEELSKDIFKWTTVDAHDAVLSNNGITAQVELFQAKPRLLVDVTLQRLLQHDNKGLWFVVAAYSSGITLGLDGQDRTTRPQNISAQSMLHAPIQLSGTSVLADGSTSVTLFNHTLTPVTGTTNIPLRFNADGTYTGALSYSGIIPDQQGLLLIQSLPLAVNNQVESGQLLLVPVLLG